MNISHGPLLYLKLSVEKKTFLTLSYWYLAFLLTFPNFYTWTFSIKKNWLNSYTPFALILKN